MASFFRRKARVVRGSSCHTNCHANTCTDMVSVASGSHLIMTISGALMQSMRAPLWPVCGPLSCPPSFWPSRSRSEFVLIVVALSRRALACASGDEHAVLGLQVEQENGPRVWQSWAPQIIIIR